MRYLICPDCGRKRVRRVRAEFERGYNYMCDWCRWFATAHKHADENDQEGLGELVKANPEARGIPWHPEYALAVGEPKEGSDAK
jgi:hypothetical protein